MKMTVYAPNGVTVEAPLSVWVAGLLSVMTEDQQSRVLTRVKETVLGGHQVPLVGPAPQIISVPTISAGEQFGQIGA